jgi:hypothetical protein
MANTRRAGVLDSIILFSEKRNISRGQVFTQTVVFRLFPLSQHSFAAVMIASSAGVAAIPSVIAVTLTVSRIATVCFRIVARKLLLSGI